MSADKHIDRICIIITVIAVLITVLFMSGEKIGIQKIVDEDAEKYSALDNFTVNDQNGEWNTEGASVITLQGDTAAISGNGAYFYNGSVVITNAGKYVVSGTLTDGYISVDAYQSSKVWILLDGMDITSSDNAAIRVEEADKVFLTLAEGSQNYLTGGSELNETAMADGTGGVIFAHDDLTINGSGSLTIVSGYKHGIDANDDLVITGGIISITAPADGIHANDSLRVMNADITINADDDGMAVTKEGGYLHIRSGKINITSGDDAIHTAGDITIDGGTITISAKDDAIHSDTEVVINNGEMLISECYEGIEAVRIEINDGTVTIYPSDDGINANGGSDSFGMGPGFRPGGRDQSAAATAEPAPTADAEPEAEDDPGWVHINGGVITIINNDARDADGIDSNGDLVITGGTIRVSLPGGGGNNAIDFGSESGGKALISGGDLAAAGGASMAENFDESSEQPVIMYNLTENVDGGTTILVLDAAGNEIINYAPPQSFNSVFLSSPELKIGKTYTIVIGESEEELTIEQDAVTLGNAGMGSFGGGSGRGGGRWQNRGVPTPNTDGSAGDPTPGQWSDMGFGSGGKMPHNGEMPDFDGTEMPWSETGGSGMRPQDGGFFDGNTPPPFDMSDGEGRMGPGGMGSRTDVDQQESEEEAMASTGKSLSEFGPEILILLSASILVLFAALGFAVLYKH